LSTRITATLLWQFFKLPFLYTFQLSTLTHLCASPSSSSSSSSSSTALPTACNREEEALLKNMQLKPSEVKLYLLRYFAIYVMACYFHEDIDPLIEWRRRKNRLVALFTDEQIMYEWLYLLQKLGYNPWTRILQRSSNDTAV
jgi:hypothetical protein